MAEDRPFFGISPHGSTNEDCFYPPFEPCDTFEAQHTLPGSTHKGNEELADCCARSLTYCLWGDIDVHLLGDQRCPHAMRMLVMQATRLLSKQLEGTFVVIACYNELQGPIAGILCWITGLDNNL